MISSRLHLLVGAIALMLIPLSVVAQTRPPSPERTAWLAKRCTQLVAFFDYYGVGRGENSDGPRNHTRIGGAIDCQNGDVRAGKRAAGKRAMEALLKRKAFDLPKPSTPEV